MLNKTNTLIFKLALLVLMPSLLFSQKNKNNWHLYKNENGIYVYTRYGDNSNYKEIKVEFSAKTSLNSISIRLGYLPEMEL
jgi:hypothetical protein